MPRSAGDLMLAAVLALLSYAPFEYVAKTTLIVAAGLFIIDPLPPYSRLIALISVAVVGLLSRMLRTWQAGQEEQEQSQEGQAEEGEEERMNGRHSSNADKPHAVQEAETPAGKESKKLN